MNKQNMGIGKKGSSRTIFVRQFRWTLKADGLDEYFMKSVNFDFCAGTFNFQAYEAYDNGIQLQEWLDNPKGPVIFTTFDGCGSAIYQYIITKITKISDTISFDYSSSDVATRCVSFTYVDIERNVFDYNLNSNLPESSFEVNNTYESNTFGTIEVEEIPVNHLNAKVWIPGKAYWNENGSPNTTN